MDVSQVQLLSRVYVISFPCFRECAPWPENVYCIQGTYSHLLDDGDSFLGWTYQFRRAMKKGIKSYTDVGSASIYTSQEIFDKVFAQFEPHRSNLNMGYSVFHFNPPKDQISGRDKSFISGFTKREHHWEIGPILCNNHRAGSHS